jgi:ADP-heptose:LPS heptosyltransferase/polysaccharide pyruvyl transferase WcaK-like protein
MSLAPSLPPDGDLALYAGGGLGDLILLAPAVAALKCARPGGRLVLFCREAAAAAVQLWPVGPDDVVTIGLEPEDWQTLDGALAGALTGLRDRLGGRRMPFLIDATLRASWFAPVLGAFLGAAQVCVTAPLNDGRGQALARAIVDYHGDVLPDLIPLSGPPRQHERLRHQAWLAAFGLAESQCFPWQLTAAAEQRALRFLAERELQHGRYLVCCPGGAGSVPIKRWPAGHFATALAGLAQPVVLLGTSHERALLEQIAAACGARAHILEVAPDDLGLSAGVLALAQCWLSNDTGPMHLAQAFARPGVGLFGGGGRWPSYAPWGPGSIGLVHPLPCFGCDWDCLFGHAACLDWIPPEAVASALTLCLQAPQAPAQIIELDQPSGGEWSLIAAASDSYQAVRRENLAQQDILVAQSREIAVQSAAAAERLALVHQLHDEAARRLDIIEALQAAPGQPVSAIQISTGLGAGNIGDELMAEAFWQQASTGLRLDVALFPAAAARRVAYSRHHRYRPVDWHGNENADAKLPGLLVGGTPVADAEGTHFPLAFIARRLECFHDAQQPVDAVGVGVETLTTAEGRMLFERAFLPIRSWSVRSEACRQRLLALGCAAEAVHVGADWAWLFKPSRDLRGWAETTWQSFGLRPGEPLILVNVVHMNWQQCDAQRRALAASLNRLARQGGFRIGLFCNEVRDGAFFDMAAARALATHLAREPIFVPNLYWSPDEAVALTARAQLTLGQRYHFALQSVLAGVLSVTIPRGEKQRDLAADVGIRQVGSMTDIDADELLAALEEELHARPTRLAVLAERRREMEWRAAGNLDLLRHFEPYSRLLGVAGEAPSL